MYYTWVRKSSATYLAAARLWKNVDSVKNVEKLGREMEIYKKSWKTWKMAIIDTDDLLFSDVFARDVRTP